MFLKKIISLVQRNIFALDRVFSLGWCDYCYLETKQINFIEYETTWNWWLQGQSVKICAGSRNL